MKFTYFKIGLNHPFFLISGPCVIESRDNALKTAEYLKNITQNLNIPFVYKSSFDKANRSYLKSFRGIGIYEGLRILEDIRTKLEIPILTDVHNIEQINIVSKVVDIIQTPAFLCRQTDFIKSCVSTGKILNIKKGQFLSPKEMKNVINKARKFSKIFGYSGDNILICERGFSFGYNNLISDMRSIPIMGNTNCPIIFDATHSVQLPGGEKRCSGGEIEFVSILSRAAISIGISGLFIETHENPIYALSDGKNSVQLKNMKKLLSSLVDLDMLIKNNNFI